MFLVIFFALSGKKPPKHGGGSWMNFPAILILGCRKFRRTKKTNGGCRSIGKGRATGCLTGKERSSFSGEKWRNNPFFSFLMQSYLVNAEMLKSAVEQAGD